MSIRYNFGNDYSAYLNLFTEMGRYSTVDFQLIGTEIGWNFLNWFFQPFGFFSMVIVLTVFEYAVIYRLIKKYVPKEWYWLSVFIFTFSTSFMLIGASMMRQFLAMCITIIAVEFIGSLTEKEMIKEYLNSNVFICPSSIENCPNSVGEAQLLGVPVISSYVGGVPDMVKLVIFIGLKRLRC